MKVPATLADLGIAVAVVWWFRDRPKLAVLAAAAVLLWPAVWYVSAWWGQYESIYVLFAVLALLAARARLPLVTAALLAVSLMTKPQALPFLVPFAAWFLATQGWRGTLKAAVVGAVVVVLLWLPFVPPADPRTASPTSGRPAGRSPASRSGRGTRGGPPGARCRRRSVRGLHGGVRRAGVPAVGVALAALFAVVVFVGVYRRPTAQGLAPGLAAMSLLAFVCLTAGRRPTRTPRSCSC